MDNLIIELVRLGFHGFALAMLLLGYRLIRTASSEGNPEFLDRRSKDIRFFMAVSVIFFVLGVGSELYAKTQAIDLIIVVNPAPSAMQPEVEPIFKKGTDLLVLDWDTGHTTISVKHGEQLYLQFYSLTKEMERLQNVVEQLLKEQAEESEGGLDDV